MQNRIVILSLGMLMEKVDTNPFIGKMIGVAKQENPAFEFTDAIKIKAFALSEQFNSGKIDELVFARNMLDLLTIKQMTEFQFLKEWGSIINTNGIAENAKKLQEASANDGAIFYVTSDTNLSHLRKIIADCKQQGKVVRFKDEKPTVADYPLYATCLHKKSRIDLIKQVVADIRKSRNKDKEITLVYGDPANIKNPAQQALAKNEYNALNEWCKENEVKIQLHNGALEQTLNELFSKKAEITHVADVPAPGV